MYVMYVQKIKNIWNQGYDDLVQVIFRVCNRGYEGLVQVIFIPESSIRQWFAWMC